MGMDLSMLAPDLAKLFGLQPSTFVLLLVAINVAARAATRQIPSTATGFWGFMRQALAIIGTEVSSKVTSDASVTDVAIAALKTPPIPQKVEEDKHDA